MYPATRITSTVPYFGRPVFLGGTIAQTTSGTIPKEVLPGDLVFCFNGGFDAGTSTNPGGVGVPTNVFTESGSLDVGLPGIKPLLLGTAIDSVTGSDEGHAYLAWTNFMGSDQVISPMYNGASGENVIMLPFGIRNLSNVSPRKTLTIKQHHTLMAINNTGSITANEQSLGQAVTQGSNYQSYRDLMSYVPNQNEFMILMLLATGCTGNAFSILSSQRKAYPSESGASTVATQFARNNFSIDISQSEATSTQVGSKYPIDLFDNIVASTTQSNMQMAYTIVGPGEKFPQYTYQVTCSTGGGSTAVICRALVEVT